MNQRVWFAVDDRKVVGGVKISLVSGKTGGDVIGPNVVINDLSVEASQRRKGYGKGLMRFVEQWVSAHDDLPQTISLAVEKDNESAARLYRSLGYETLEQNGEVYLMDGSAGKRCFLMYKRLRP